MRLSRTELAAGIAWSAGLAAIAAAVLLSVDAMLWIGALMLLLAHAAEVTVRVAKARSGDATPPAVDRSTALGLAVAGAFVAAGFCVLGAIVGLVLAGVEGTPLFGGAWKGLRVTLVLFAGGFALMLIERALIRTLARR